MLFPDFCRFFLKTLERNTLSNMNNLKAASSELNRAISEKDIYFSLTDLFVSLGQICHASSTNINEIGACLHAGVLPGAYREVIDSISVSEKKVFEDP